MAKNPAGRSLIFLVILAISPAFLYSAMCHSEETHSPGSIEVSWSATQPSALMKIFTIDDLKSMKKVTSSEEDPASGKPAKFEGVLLSALIDKALVGMSNDKKSLFDLVILKNAAGSVALIPRSFIVKYPLMLASSENRKPLGNLESVVPWTSHSKSRQEGLPLATYFVPNVSQIELSNYRNRYDKVFLKRRTEPLAIRGEKNFVQGCLSCHDSAQGIQKARGWLGQHPAVNGLPKLDDRDLRSLRSYLDQSIAENSPVSQ
jgi:hypothetical protein